MYVRVYRNINIINNVNVPESGVNKVVEGLKIHARDVSSNPSRGEKNFLLSPQLTDHQDYSLSTAYELWPNSFPANSLTQYEYHQYILCIHSQ